MRFASRPSKTHGPSYQASLGPLSFVAIARYNFRPCRAGGGERHNRADQSARGNPRTRRRARAQPWPRVATRTRPRMAPAPPPWTPPRARPLHPPLQKPHNVLCLSSLCLSSSISWFSTSLDPDSFRVFPFRSDGYV